MEEILWVTTPLCRDCVPRKEFAKRAGCVGCDRLRPSPVPRKSKAAHPKNAPLKKQNSVRFEERNRSVLALRQEGCSLGKIAAELGLPRSTVQGIVARAEPGFILKSSTGE